MSGTSQVELKSGRVQAPAGNPLLLSYVAPYDAASIIRRALLTGGGLRFDRDLCVCAPTGSGKTLAYALPVVQALGGRACQILLPSRHLSCPRLPPRHLSRPHWSRRHILIPHWPLTMSQYTICSRNKAQGFETHMMTRQQPHPRPYWTGGRVCGGCAPLSLCPLGTWHRKQGLTLIHFSAQPEPLLTENTP